MIIYRNWFKYTLDEEHRLVQSSSPLIHRHPQYRWSRQPNFRRRRTIFARGSCVVEIATVQYRKVRTPSCVFPVAAVNDFGSGNVCCTTINKSNAAAMAKQTYNQASLSQSQLAPPQRPPHLLLWFRCPYYHSKWSNRVVTTRVPTHCGLLLCFFFPIHLPHTTGCGVFLSCFHLRSSLYSCFFFLITRVA